MMVTAASTGLIPIRIVYGRLLLDCRSLATQIKKAWQRKTLVTTKKKADVPNDTSFPIIISNQIHFFLPQVAKDAWNDDHDDDSYYYYYYHVGVANETTSVCVHLLFSPFQA